MSKLTCRICGKSDDNRKYVVKEMMFGSHEEFEYFLCSECGCLQINHIPEDLSRFYPPTYYSFNPNISSPTDKSGLRKALEQLRVKNALFGRGFKLAKLASQLVDLPPRLSEIGPWLKKCGIQSMDAKFLDVGSGSSSWWLNDLKAIGFRNLMGVDPYIDSDINENGIQTQKGRLDEVQGSFDLITLHHSLEHVPDQVETMKTIRSLLRPGKFCLIRIPVVSSTVWEQYGTDWVELDAPRHLYLHSLKSIEHVGVKAGLKLVDHFCDSTEFEFWGSEQNRRGIPLRAEDSFSENPSMSSFTYREMADFKKRAEEANLSGQGGRGCFIFQAIQ